MKINIELFQQYALYNEKTNKIVLFRVMPKNNGEEGVYVGLDHGDVYAVTNVKIFQKNYNGSKHWTMLGEV